MRGSVSVVKRDSIVSHMVPYTVPQANTIFAEELQQGVPGIRQSTHCRTPVALLIFEAQNLIAVAAIAFRYIRGAHREAR